MSDALLQDLHLLVYKYGENVSSYLCPSEAAMRKVVERLEGDFEESVDDIMQHLNQIGEHGEGDAVLMAPDLEVTDEKGDPVPWPQKTAANSPNHYLVTGHLEGEHNDYIRYVVAPAVFEAEEAFKKHLVKVLCLKHEETKARIMVSVAVQIPGPPVAIYTDEGVEENPEPIQ